MKISKEIKFYGFVGFLAVILVYIIAQFYIKSHLQELGWTISDWLINYEDGGFKRRGLSGSLLFFVQDNLDIPLNTQIFIIQSFFFILIFYFVIRLIMFKKLNWDILILLCSPLCLLFFPVNIFNSGRKEIILIALVLFFVCGKQSDLKKYILFIGFIIGLFLHELFYFYLPFVMAAYFLKTKKVDFKYLGSLFLTSTLVILILFFWGGEINQGKSLELLKHRGVQFTRLNIFTYDVAKERKGMLNAYQSYILFGLELLFMIFLSFTFVKKYLPQKVKSFKIFTLISLIWVSPIYILGADWFRWNHIYAILLIILIIISLPGNSGKMHYIEGKLNISLLIINILFFAIFFLHIQYDNSGNSTKYLLQYIENKLPFLNFGV
ncbi:hypothetical protein QFZ37_001704 [Chryseobacterium ginsenosidimutans]|uniref:hypothetical protein n=1 Tax=Chryseobacterium ginsenosidimutans TaxID=687846 RepID=UPI00277EE8F8|nr:hypothetical protein [Chryseobacterium ginsenosidimutans]MDQ0593335.1 hypothetical protein [Chryseobacterium ginsenosidimutans]